MTTLYVTDWNMQGSGYYSIGSGLVPALTKSSTEDIIVLGLNYWGQEHINDFTIVPTEFPHIATRIQYLHEQLDIDKVVVALDIKEQRKILGMFPAARRPFRYIGITSIDGGPVPREWGFVIGEMNECFVISDFIKQSCTVAGLEVEHLPIATNDNWFGHPDSELRQRVREKYGASGKFIILTVADNHERKNLSGAMQMVAKLYESHEDIEYWLVTRLAAQGTMGWFIETMARSLGIRRITHVFDRDIKYSLLYMLYVCADVLLLPSKAEGLGMPVLEAQQVGAIPVVTKTSGMIELIEGGSGLFIEPEFCHIDAFGNTHRCFPSVEDGARKLEMVYNASEYARELMRQHGRDYQDTRTWDDSAQFFWDIVDRNRQGTVAFRSKAPWYFSQENLQLPDFQYEGEHIGK